MKNVKDPSLCICAKVPIIFDNQYSLKNEDIETEVIYMGKNKTHFNTSDPSFNFLWEGIMHAKPNIHRFGRIEY